MKNWVVDRLIYALYLMARLKHQDASQVLHRVIVTLMEEIDEEVCDQEAWEVGGEDARPANEPTV